VATPTPFVQPAATPKAWLRPLAAPSRCPGADRGRRRRPVRSLPVFELSPPFPSYSRARAASKRVAAVADH
jgi:hypothetical protein